MNDNMNRKYFLKSPHKVALRARLIAKAIDLLIIFILTFFLYPLGVILAVIYMAISDFLPNGQSVGKKFMGFAVISLEDGKPCNLRQSVVRNLPIIIPLIFFIIPLWGWAFAVILGIPLILLELYLLFKLDSGHRLGDVMADTTIIASIDSKEKIKQEKENPVLGN